MFDWLFEFVVLLLELLMIRCCCGELICVFLGLFVLVMCLVLSGDLKIKVCGLEGKFWFEFL